MYHTTLSSWQCLDLYEVIKAVINGTVNYSDEEDRIMWCMTVGFPEKKEAKDKEPFEKILVKNVWLKAGHGTSHLHS